MEDSHNGVVCVPKQYRNRSERHAGSHYNVLAIVVLLVGRSARPCEAGFVSLVEVSSRNTANPFASLPGSARSQYHVTVLLAKITKQPKKRQSRSNRRGETSSNNNPNSQQKLPPQDTVSPVTRLPRPPLKQHTFSLQRAFLSPLKVVAFQVEDPAWWQQANEAVEASGGDDSSNPFGARLWPSALGIAEFLVHHHHYHHDNDNEFSGNHTRMTNRKVLELGCGGGLCSIVAASLGAQVVASDISSTVLELTDLGWSATKRQRAQREEKKNEDTFSVGSLTTRRIDLASKGSLPIGGRTDEKQPIVMAAAMLYSTELAFLLARRSFEAAYQHNAWVIIGDDDSGEREGGRNLFFEELDRLEHQVGRSVSRTITKSVVKDQALKWREKRIQVIHLNHPDDVGFG